MKCEKVSLFDLACWKNGLAFKNIQFADKGKPIIKIAELKNGITTQTRFTEQVFDDNVSLKKGDMLFSWSGNPETSIDVYWYELPDGWLNQHIFKVTPKEFIDKFYLYYLLKSFKKVFTNIASNKQTTGLGHVTVKDLKEIFVNLPDLSYQRLIGEYLNKIDEKIRINNRINDNLLKQAQILFKRWFIDNPDIALWKEGTFSELIERIIGGDWGKESPSGNHTEMVYCIRGADIPDVRNGNKGKMPTRYILPKNYDSKHLINGDIVVEISGGSPTQSTGRAAAISTALLNRYYKGMICTNFCKAIKPKVGYSMYVYHYWQYLYNKDIFFSYENGTTGIKNLDINGFIETEPISIAPASLVNKFDNFCQFVFSSVYANGLENEQLSLLRDTLLTKLISGEIDVSDIQL